MTIRRAVSALFRIESLNFRATNRFPRRAATRVMGRLSRLEHPWVVALGLRAWRVFAPDLDLSDARETRFTSLHACFTRRLKDGARPIDRDPRVLVSPCDAVVGATGRVVRGQLLQAKGRRYTLGELLVDDDFALGFEGGCYATLRLKSTMYHRFHAPDDCVVRQVTHVPGEVWNVNPATLRRVPRLYERNERAVLRLSVAEDHVLALVPVAAVLVAGLRFRFLEVPPPPRAAGPRVFPCDARLARGEEMGWFEHGSTIVVVAPAGFTLAEGIASGALVRVGRPLLRRPAGDQKAAAAVDDDNGGRATSGTM